MSSLKGFKRVVTGQNSWKNQLKYLILILSIFATGCILAQIFYPGGFSIVEYYISNQGWIAENPVGCWFFIVGTTMTGCLLVPHFIFMHRQLMPAAKILSYLSTLASITGSIGLAMVGFITKDEATDAIHDVAADLAFIGLGAGAGLALLVMIRKLTLKESWPTLKGFFILFIIIIAMGISVALIEDNQLQQWIGLFTMLTWLVGSFIICK